MNGFKTSFGLEILGFGLAVAVAGPAGAESGEFPPLNMHVFSDDSHLLPAPSEPQTMAAYDGSDFQMVVFSDELPAGNAGMPEAQATDERNEDFSFYYELSSGYQRDDVSWNVASPAPSGSSGPAIEAEWKDIDMWRLDGRFDIRTPIGAVAKGAARYARVLDDSVGQTVYLGDNRTLPYAQTQSVSDDGYVLGGSIGAGYRFTIGNGPVRAVLTPLGGYAFERQKLTLPVNSASDYVAEWQGPWLGVDGNIAWLDAHELFASFEHHWADYEAEWRQSDGSAQPLSFKHTTDAAGWKGLVGYRYNTSDVWGMSLTFDYQRWDGDPGTERAVLVDGIQVESNLNEVTRESMGVNLGVNMKF